MAAAVLFLSLVFLALSLMAIVYVIGIRSRSPMVRNAARRFHHAVGNPLQMRSAGTRGAHASVIRHEGRNTGKIYETPVWAVSTEDGFAIPIVYGSRTNWLNNVLASGTAVIVHKGETYRVDQPQIVPMHGVRTNFPDALQRIHRQIRVDRCLRVRRVEAAGPSTAQKVDASCDGSERR